MVKVGIITFHHSYNCGSMMQAFAMQKIVEKLGYIAEIIDFSNDGQKKLYSAWFSNNSIKNMVKNLLIMPHIEQIKINNACYEEFMKEAMNLSSAKFSELRQLDDDGYNFVIAGSDQIWNITIDDSDDAYFLPWVKKAVKIAYAPSFGARNIAEYASDKSVYAAYIRDIKNLSVREKNGKRWIKELTGSDAAVVLDPTLLLERADYDCLIKNNLDLPDNYIFYYAPHYSKDINLLVESISKKYKMPVVAFNSKNFYVKRMNVQGFMLPSYESPASYLELIKKAGLIITTSFHGTVFSSIYKKKFWIVKNGGMLANDDRVKTMTDMLDLGDRIIPIVFDEKIDYLKEKDYSTYETNLKIHQKRSKEFLSKALSSYEDKV